MSKVHVLGDDANDHNNQYLDAIQTIRFVMGSAAQPEEVGVSAFNTTEHRFLRFLGVRPADGEIPNGSFCFYFDTTGPNDRLIAIGKSEDGLTVRDAVVAVLS